MLEVPGEDDLLEGPHVVDEERTDWLSAGVLAPFGPTDNALKLFFLQNRVGFLDEVVDAAQRRPPFISSEGRALGSRSPGGL